MIPGESALPGLETLPSPGHNGERGSRERGCRERGCRELFTVSSYKDSNFLDATSKRSFNLNYVLIAKAVTLSLGLACSTFAGTPFGPQHHVCNCQRVSLSMCRGWDYFQRRCCFQKDHLGRHHVYIIAQWDPNLLNTPGESHGVSGNFRVGCDNERTPNLQVVNFETHTHTLDPPAG